MTKKTIEEIENNIINDLRHAVHNTETKVVSATSVTCGHVILSDGLIAEVTVKVNIHMKDWNDQDFLRDYLMEKVDLCKEWKK